MKKNLIVILLVIMTLQSCGTCSHHVNTSVVSDSVEAPYVSHGREVWSTLADVGFPVIPDSISSSWLERYCYTTSYNKVTRQPNWVMWQLTGDHVMQRKEGIWNEYREDPDLPADERAMLADYASSGYDRGHMCPGGDCNWDDKGRDETYVLSNMCPQNPNLNRGDWKEIENACRKWAQKYGSIYIVCGPIFLNEEHQTIGGNKVMVPEAFFKVILCMEGTPKGIAFICRNTDGNRKKDYYVNTISQVERITGYTFFPFLDDDTADAIKEHADLKNW